MSDVVQPAPGSIPEPPAPPKSWIGPAIFLVIVLVPVLILIFSNTDSADFSWAGFEWSAPGWVILGLTFIAGAVLSRLLAWVWRKLLVRRRRIRAEYDAVTDA